VPTLDGEDKKSQDSGLLLKQLEAHATITGLRWRAGFCRDLQKRSAATSWNWRAVANCGVYTVGAMISNSVETKRVLRNRRIRKRTMAKEQIGNMCGGPCRDGAGRSFLTRVTTCEGPLVRVLLYGRSQPARGHAIALRIGRLTQ